MLKTMLNVWGFFFGVTVWTSAHSPVFALSSLQLLRQSSVGFSEYDQLLVQQDDLLLQLLNVAQLLWKQQQQ